MTKKTKPDPKSAIEWLRSLAIGHDIDKHDMRMIIWIKDYITSKENYPEWGVK